MTLLRLFAGIIIFLMGLSAYSYFKDFPALQQRAKVRSQLESTAPGKFALASFDECKRAQGLFNSGKPEAECINTVVTAAKNLKGEAFSSAVAKSLDTWIEEKGPN